MSNTNYILTPDGNFVSEDELYHYGVLGMKWGVRKARISDGSLTTASRKSYPNNSVRQRMSRPATYENKARKEQENRKKKASRAKKIAIGAAAVTALVGGVYGAKKISQLKRFKSSIEAHARSGNSLAQHVQASWEVGRYSIPTKMKMASLNAKGNDFTNQAYEYSNSYYRKVSKARANAVKQKAADELRAKQDEYLRKRASEYSRSK